MMNFPRDLDSRKRKTSGIGRDQVKGFPTWCKAFLKARVACAGDGHARCQFSQQSGGGAEIWHRRKREARNRKLRGIGNRGLDQQMHRPIWQARSIAHQVKRPLARTDVEAGKSDRIAILPSDIDPLIAKILQAKVAAMTATSLLPSTQ